MKSALLTVAWNGSDWTFDALETHYKTLVRYLNLEDKGMVIFLLFIAHHVLNRNWYKSMFKGRYTSTRIFQLVIDLSVFVTMLMLMYSSIVMSRFVFSFLPIQGGMMWARRLHLLGAYWGFVLMSLFVFIAHYLTKIMRKQGGHHK